MKGSRYTVEQVSFAMRQAESGTPVSEICRNMGISEQTFYRWKKKFSGMGVAEVRRLRILEEENRKLHPYLYLCRRCLQSRQQYQHRQVSLSLLCQLPRMK